MIKTFKEYLIEDENDIRNNIHNEYKNELKKRKINYYKLTADHTNYPSPGGSVVVNFFQKGERKGSVGFSLKKHPSGNYNLELFNQYLPENLRNKGITTSVLSNIKNTKGLSGYAKPDRPGNKEGWKSIIKKSGFKWTGE